MILRDLDVTTADGTMRTFVHHPTHEGPHPVVLYLMDAPTSEWLVMRRWLRVGAAAVGDLALIFAGFHRGALVGGGLPSQVDHGHVDGVTDDVGDVGIGDQRLDRSQRHQADPGDVTGVTGLQAVASERVGIDGDDDLGLASRPAPQPPRQAGLASRSRGDVGILGRDSILGGSMRRSWPTRSTSAVPALAAQQRPH